MAQIMFLFSLSAPAISWIVVLSDDASAQSICVCFLRGALVVITLGAVHLDGSGSNIDTGWPDMSGVR